MNMKQSFISVFSNWNNFSGRACRSEYWYFLLSVYLIAFILSIFEVLLGIKSTEIGYVYGPLTLIFQIIVIIPSISLTSRRLQDRGISGWWQLLQLTIIAIPVLIIIFMLPAKEDENKWGRNPLLD